MGIRYDMVLNVFDRSIIEVENRVYADAMTTNLMRALERTFKGMPETAGRADAIRAPIKKPCSRNALKISAVTSARGSLWNGVAGSVIL